MLKDPEYYKKVHGWYRKKRQASKITYDRFSGLLVPVTHSTSTLTKLSDDLVEEDRPKNNPFLIQFLREEDMTEDAADELSLILEKHVGTALYQTLVQCKVSTYSAKFT